MINLTVVRNVDEENAMNERNHLASARCRMAMLAATIAGAGLFVTVPAAAQDAWGVIAFGHTDEGVGVAYGLSWNYPARDAAHAAAKDACISIGCTDCAQLAWFRNGCGALAMDDHGNAQGKAPCRASRQRRAPCAHARRPGETVARSSVPHAPFREESRAHGQEVKTSSRSRVLRRRT